MDKYGVEGLGLSEVRWTTSGKATLASGNVLLYSGPPNEGYDHRNGVGIMLTKKANRNLTEWESINERILRAWCQSKFQKVSIIQCYAPTNTADQEIKEDPYEQLQVVEAIKKIKNCKAPGPDTIPPEVMKAETALQDAWEKEEVPTEWKTDYIYCKDSQERGS